MLRHQTDEVSQNIKNFSPQNGHGQYSRTDSPVHFPSTGKVYATVWQPSLMPLHYITDAMLEVVFHVTTSQFQRRNDEERKKQENSHYFNPPHCTELLVPLPQTPDITRAFKWVGQAGGGVCGEENGWEGGEQLNKGRGLDKHSVHMLMSFQLLALNVGAIVPSCFADKLVNCDSQSPEVILQ